MHQSKINVTSGGAEQLHRRSLWSLSHNSLAAACFSDTFLSAPVNEGRHATNEIGTRAREYKETSFLRSLLILFCYLPFPPRCLLRPVFIHHSPFTSRLVIFDISYSPVECIVGVNNVFATHATR